MPCQLLMDLDGVLGRGVIARPDEDEQGYPRREHHPVGLAGNIKGGD